MTTNNIYNIISVIIFGIFAVVCFVGGFYNPLHWLFAGFCVTLVTTALHDDTDGESLIEQLKKRVSRCSRTR